MLLKVYKRTQMYSRQRFPIYFMPIWSLDEMFKNATEKIPFCEINISYQGEVFL